MITINDFFDKVYCINLDERVDRWGDVQQEFKKLNIDNVIRFSAVKNNDGALGCRDSHLGVIKDAKEKGYDKILVFEDDISVLTENINRIESTLTDLGSISWELFYLGATVEPNIGKLTPFGDGNLVKTNFAYTTHAYGIHSSIFDLVLSEAPKHRIIDVYYCHQITQKRKKSFIINPMVCLQKNTYSDIEKKEIDYSWMVEYFNRTLNKNV